MKAEKLCKESGETMTCKDCEKRTSDCHIDCQDYKEQQKKYEAIREARRLDSL